MALTGKLVGHVEISSHADVLHDLLRHKPNDIASISEPVHSCDLVSGQQGVVGSVICWNYTHGTFLGELGFVFCIVFSFTLD